MTQITATAVKSLRDRTGAGMMDCKRALEEAAGDEEKAIDILRQRGAAKAAKRSARETTEGTLAIARHPDAGSAAMAELASETDFVARNEEFLGVAERAARAALDAPLPNGEVVGGGALLDLPEHADLSDELNELRGKIGENIQLVRVVRFAPAPQGTVGSYLHFGNRIGVLVELGGAAPSQAVSGLARDLALHIAAAAPIGIAPDDIPKTERERERAVLTEQARQEGKPPAIVQKIVEGRLRKYYEQNALLLQGFVKDPDIRIESLLHGVSPDLSVRRFVRFEVGA
ncbi:MAG: translation elongation factor Ts [Gemmatimonadota bacterium]